MKDSLVGFLLVAFVATGAGSEPPIPIYSVEPAFTGVWTGNVDGEAWTFDVSVMGHYRLARETAAGLVTVRGTVATGGGRFLMRSGSAAPVIEGTYQAAPGRLDLKFADKAVSLGLSDAATNSS